MGAKQQQPPPPLPPAPPSPPSDRSEESSRSDDGGMTSDTQDPTADVREAVLTEIEDWADVRGITITKEATGLLMELDDYGRLYTMHNIHIARHTEKMSTTVGDWVTRLQHPEHMFQARGWVKTYKTRNGAHVYLPHAARQRGKHVRALCYEAGWDVEMETILCGLTVRELDEFFLKFRPYGDRGGRYLREKAEKYVCQCLEKGHTGTLDGMV